MANVYHGPNAESRNLRERLEKAEQLNAELARMLRSLEWSEGRETGCCSHCDGNKAFGHDPDCALAALLKKARTA